MAQPPEMMGKHHSDPFKPDSTVQDRFNKSDFALAGIPAAQPGPNAFAQKAMARERHHLQSNAFYAQAVAKRTATPQSSLHPALRQRSNSDATLHPSRDAARDAARMTTMSPFINAGKADDPMPSPPLTLVPDGIENSQPTLRNDIELKHERTLGVATQPDGAQPHTLVYSPKVASNDFAKPGPMAKNLFARDPALASASELTKNSPKKGFFDRFRIINSKIAGSAASLDGAGGSFTPIADDKVPPKAQAVLGASSTPPPQTAIGRSPSKKKAMLSRKNTDGAGDPTPSKSSSFFRRSFGGSDLIQAGSMSGRTSQVASTEPSSAGADGGSSNVSPHILADSAQDPSVLTEEARVARSKSLQYFDKTVPPTPPAKNTPPHARGVQGASVREHVRRAVTAKDEAPKEMVMLSTSGRLSPTKFGSYGNRDNATLVKRPSVYSMHASIFPDLNDSMSYDELKSRVDGFGLEGLSKLPDHLVDRHPELYYSPSIYSSDGDRRSGAEFHSPAWGQIRKSLAMPAIAEHHVDPIADTHTSPTPSQATLPSSKTIDVYYPDVLKDLSNSDLIKLAETDSPPRTLARLSAGALFRWDIESGGILPYHGGTRSLDHSPEQRERFPDADIFASPTALAVKGSPESLYHHSAAPSPLMTLPPTKYVAPLKARITNAKVGAGAICQNGSPPPPRSSNTNIVENAPELGKYLSMAQSSPERYVNALGIDTEENVDPRKASRPPLESKPNRQNEELKQLIKEVISESWNPSPESSEGSFSRIVNEQVKKVCRDLVAADMRFACERVKDFAADVEAVKRWQANIDGAAPVLERLDAGVDRYRADTLGLHADLARELAEMNARVDARLAAVESSSSPLSPAGSGPRDPYLPHAALAALASYHRAGQQRVDFPPALADAYAARAEQEPYLARHESTYQRLTAAERDTDEAFNQMMLSMMNSVSLRLEGIEKKMGASK